MPGATDGTSRPRSRASREILYRLARAMRLSVSGEASARSHLETACRLTPRLAARASWDRPRDWRSSTRRLAMVRFIGKTPFCLGWTQYSTDVGVQATYSAFQPGKLLVAGAGKPEVAGLESPSHGFAVTAPFNKGATAMCRRHIAYNARSVRVF